MQYNHFIDMNNRKQILYWYYMYYITIYYLIPLRNTKYLYKLRVLFLYIIIISIIVLWSVI